MSDQHIHACAIPHNSRIHSITSFRDRDDWIKMLLASDGDELSPGAKVAGIRIALHRNIETGRCDPSIGMLVSGTGMSESTVRRMIRELEAAGWLRVDRTRGRHSNSFELRAPTLSNATGLNPVNRDRVESSNPVISERVQEIPTLSAVTPQPCHARHRDPVTVDAQKREGKANRKAKARDSLPLDLCDRDSGHRSRNDSADLGANFEEWYRTYPKRVAKEAARKAHRGVISKEKATPEELLVGAMRAAAAFDERVKREGRAKAHQFTKNPVTWLRGGCWMDETIAPVAETASEGWSSGFGRHIDEALADAQAAAARSTIQ